MLIGTCNLILHPIHVFRRYVKLLGALKHFSVYSMVLDAHGLLIGACNPMS